MNCDHAWAAGFWEADGCIHLATKAGGYRRPVVSATQSSLDPLMELQNLFGGYIQEVSTPKGKPHFRWSLQRGSSVQYFLKSVYPFIRSEKRKAKVSVGYCLSRAIDHCRARHDGRSIYVARRSSLEGKFDKL